LPNQDVVNSVAHISRWAGGVDTRLHDIPNVPVQIPALFGTFLQQYIGEYLLAARHLIAHAGYMAFGRLSGAHGVLAR
jgi:glycosylphosphatidylinositol transamidase